MRSAGPHFVISKLCFQLPFDCCVYFECYIKMPPPLTHAFFRHVIWRKGALCSAENILNNSNSVSLRCGTFCLFKNKMFREGVISLERLYSHIPVQCQIVSSKLQLTLAQLLCSVCCRSGKVFQSWTVDAKQVCLVGGTNIYGSCIVCYGQTLKTWVLIL